MTVCIAAITRDREIVTVSDTMVSNYFCSMDGATVKLKPLHDDWTAMMSGEDLGDCLGIIDHSEDYFKPGAATQREAITAFKQGYKSYIAEVAADIVLAPFDLDIKEFKKSGKKIFTDEIFNSLSHKIESEKEKLNSSQFIGYGFDGQGEAHVFLVLWPGIGKTRDKPGFACIGAGADAAAFTLYSLGQTVNCNLYETIYNLCAAKFAAEKVQIGIGRDTYLYARKRGSSMFTTPIDFVPRIRAAWEKDGGPKIPAGIIKEITETGIYQLAIT